MDKITIIAEIEEIDCASPKIFIENISKSAGENYLHNPRWCVAEFVHDRNQKFVSVKLSTITGERELRDEANKMIEMANLLAKL